MIFQSAALLTAIKDYEANKWKVIGAKVGKPAKVCVFEGILVFLWLMKRQACEQYAKEHFVGKV